MQNTKNKIKKWWNGEVYKNEPESNVFMVGIYRHWTSEGAHKMLRFVEKEYKFLIYTLLIITGLLMPLI